MAVVFVLLECETFVLSFAMDITLRICACAAYARKSKQHVCHRVWQYLVFSPEQQPWCCCSSLGQPAVMVLDRKTPLAPPQKSQKEFSSDTKHTFCTFFFILGSEKTSVCNIFSLHNVAKTTP
jgi:hypothetical protein